MTRVREMTTNEVREFIRANSSGILALAENGRAYCVPMYYAYDGRDVYFHTREGLKEKYAAATEEACFTIVRATATDIWASVQVFGDLEQVPPSLRAQDALLRVPYPPDWGETVHGEPLRRGHDIILYKLRVRRTSGRHSDAAPISAEEREIAYGGM